MTLEELDRRIDLLAVTYPEVVSLTDVASFVNIPVGSWSYLRRFLPAADLPQTFYAYGMNMMHKRMAIEWAKDFIRKHPQRCGVTQ